jgi:hypothetical protein
MVPIHFIFRTRPLSQEFFWDLKFRSVQKRHTHAPKQHPSAINTNSKHLNDVRLERTKAKTQK